MYFDELLLRLQRLDMIFISLDILLKGNESISFVLFLIFFKFIIFDVEEDKNFGKIFIKNVSLLKKKKNVVKIFGYEERFDLQKEVDVFLFLVRKFVLYDEILKKGVDFVGFLVLFIY